MYCEFYQLTERPFNVTPDPKFLYLNARYREAIASLNYGITQRKGFITLIGEAGTGKTTLLKRLLEDLDPKTKTVFIFNTNVTFEEILEYIFAEFDLPVHNGKKLYMLQRLNTFLLEELRAGGNVALLIDEAQDLEYSVLEDLRLLSNLETAKEKILQIVLSGQPELGQKLSNPILRQLRQRISINCRLLPLSRDEITEYLQYRLQAAGCPDLKLFTRDAEDQIYHFSRGVPRLVNVVCDNALVIGYALGKKRIGGDIVKEAAADLVPVDLHESEPKSQVAAPAVVAPAAGAAPKSESRWGTQVAALAAVLGVVALTFLSIFRTSPESASAERVAAARDQRVQVVNPGARDAGESAAAKPAGEPPPPRPPAMDEGAAGHAAADAEAIADDAEIIAEEKDGSPGLLSLRDPREEARRRREELAWNRAVPDLREGQPRRERFQRIEPPQAAREELAEPGAAIPPAAQESEGEPVRIQEPAVADAPAAEEPPSRSVPVVAPRIEEDDIEDDFDELAPRVPVAPAAEAVEEMGDSDELEEEPFVEERIEIARAAPAARVEPLPLEAVEEMPDEIDGIDAPHSGAAIIDIDDATEPAGPRLDGVRFARVRVQPGDSVSGIAIRRYGQASPTILDLMKLANPNVTDIDMIVVGQTIRLPQLEEAFPILNEGDGRYALLAYSTVEGWRANTLSDELKSKGFSASVSHGRLGATKPIYRVVVGGFNSRDEVLEAGRRLQRVFREDRRVTELSNPSE
jgi:general secretion pathway protein A